MPQSLCEPVLVSGSPDIMAVMSHQQSVDTVAIIVFGFLQAI